MRRVASSGLDTDPLLLGQSCGRIKETETVYGFAVLALNNIMPQEDFDLASLAKYLHLTPAQISRMAERGTLPGRKVAGQWRFPQAEIHHWLEERIGASDESELIKVEGVLERSAGNQEHAELTITGMLPSEAIAVPLQARTRSSVMSKMCELAASTGLLWDPDKMEQAIRARENLHPTALENGVALMHPRRPLSNILAEPMLALGCTHQGIPFGGGRGSMTDIFFLICSTDDRGHLRTLARLSRLISDGALISDIRAAVDAQQVRKLIEEYEEKLFG